MIFTLTDRHYNVLDAYETDDYLIGQYIGSILETLEINVLVKSLNAEHWVEGNYIMCKDKKGKKRWFTIYDCEDSHSGDVKSLFCYSGTIDIVAEDAAPISAPDPKPFKWYFDTIFYDTGIELGINEISGLTRKLEFTSENASNAEMLQYVLNGFDNAEASLDVEFDGATPTKLVLNVYKRIGNEEPQAILSDEDDSLTSLDRKGSISDLATCINPTGAEDENGNPITLLGKYYEEKDENGNILYYSPVDSPRVFSVVARQNFYVQLPGKANGEFDGYINRRYESQATTQDTLWQESLSQLKKIDHVAVTYEANGYIDCSIGDNVQIVSHEMKPPVMIAARTIEYKFNDDDPSRNVYKFGNYVELASNLDELSKIIAEVKKQVEPQVVEAERTAKVYAETISVEKAAQAESNAKGYTDTVKVQVVEHANTVANQAENNAKEHADTVASEAESNAKAYALSEADKAKIAAIQAAATDAQTKVNAAKTALEADIATKVDAEWVNGQLISKADKASTYTKTEVDNALNSKVSVTQYTTDMNGVVTRLNSAESRITQTENEIATKVSNTTYQQDKTTINSNISQLQTKMSNAETSISQLSNQIALKANKTDVYTKTEVDGQFNTVNQQISQLDAELTVQAGQIASKVSKTDLQSLKNGILKVRYVRDWAKGNSVNSRNHWVEVKVMSGTTNRASGKTPTSNYSLTYGNRVTDGDTNSNNYAEGALGAVSQYVQIDLGAVYEDIDYIQVWHYYNDGRTYNGTKVEVSADGTNWITVFDSAVSGTYKETADGLIVPINNSVLNSFNKRVSSAETSITQLSNQIQLKANKTDVYTKTEADNKVTTAVNNAKSEIKLTTDSISQSVSSLQGTVNSQGTRLSSVESTITQQADLISQKVSKTDYNGNTIASLINQTATTIKLQAAKIALDGYVEAKHIKSLNGLNVGNGQFVVDANGNVKFAGNLEGASGTFGQVTVKDGDFYLKNTKSGIRYSLVKKTNILGDHSFELIKLGDPTSQDNIDHWWLPIITDNTNWETIGAPRGVPMSIAGPGPADAMPIFGNFAVMVNSTNYIEQPVWDVTANTQYTFSVHAKRPYNNTPGAVRLEVYYEKYNTDGTSTRQLVAAQSFETVASDYSVSRHALTFTSPNIARTGSDGIIFVIKGVNANWVHVDGVQVVKSAYPTVYDTEDSLWSFMNSRNGFKARAIWTEGIYNGVNGIDIDDNRIRIYSNASLNYFSVENIESRFSTVPYDQWKDPEPNVKKAIKINGGIATDTLYANAGTISKTAISTNGKIYVGGEGIEIAWPGGTPYIDFVRLGGYDYNARISIQSDSSLAFMFNDNATIRHRFYANGTKSGGSIEIDGKNLGMSPIDSPQILLETIEFDVPLTETGTKVLLDTRFAKAVNYRFAVFPNNGKVIEKGDDYFIIAGTGTADIRIVGERVGYAGVYFDDMTMEGVV